MNKSLLCLLLLFIGMPSFASYAELSKQATAFYADNNPTKTIDLLLQIDECERSAQDWILLGNIMADKGEIENSAYMYQKAIAKDKKSYKAHYNLGNYYFNKGQLLLALDAYKKAAHYNNDNPYIYYNIACVYIKQNNLKNARTYLNKAIALNPNIPEFHYNLAFIYKKLNNTKMSNVYMKNYKQLTEN